MLNAASLLGLRHSCYGKGQMGVSSHTFRPLALSLGYKEGFYAKGSKALAQVAQRAACVPSLPASTESLPSLLLPRCTRGSSVTSPEQLHPMLSRSHSKLVTHSAKRKVFFLITELHQLLHWQYAIDYLHKSKECLVVLLMCI